MCFFFVFCFSPSTDVINEPLQLHTLLFFLSHTIVTTSPYAGSRRDLQGRRESPLSLCQMSTSTSRVTAGDKRRGLGVVGQQAGEDGCSFDERRKDRDGSGCLRIIRVRLGHFGLSPQLRSAAGRFSKDKMLLTPVDFPLPGFGLSVGMVQQWTGTARVGPRKPPPTAQFLRLRDPGQEQKCLDGEKSSKIKIGIKRKINLSQTWYERVKVS